MSPLVYGILFSQPKQTETDVERIFMCLLPICIYSLEKYLLKSSADLKIGFVSFYYWNLRVIQGFPGGASGNPTANAWEKRCEFYPWLGKILWRRAWQTTPVFSPGESHGQKNLAGYSP